MYLHAFQRRFARHRRPTARRGAIVMLFVGFMVISLLMGALALNWSYLVLVQRDMQFRGDAIALAAAPALLDEGLLRNQSPNQSDDLADARLMADSYRKLNNAANGAKLQLQAADLHVDAGHVASIAQPIGPGNPFSTTEPYNTLRVRIVRDDNGSNPVEPLVNPYDEAEPVEIGTTSYATLDNRLIGFQPTAATAAPLLPIAVSATEWDANWAAGSDEYSWSRAAGVTTGSNDIREFKIRLTSSGGTIPGNALLIDLTGTTVFNISEVETQIAQGLHGPSHFGPATPTTPLVRLAADTTTSEAQAMELTTAFAARAGECRVVPLYSAFPGSYATLTGFVAVRILFAEDEEVGTEHCVTLTVEPCFIIHTTARTDPAADENPWIHKLRIRR